MVDHLLDAGVEGIFVLSTAGEDVSLSTLMCACLVAVTMDEVHHRKAQVTLRQTVLYASIGSNRLAESVAAAKQYRQVGIDVLVARLPTYFALSDEEQHAYFQALLEQVPGPLMLDSIPNTTHMAIPIPVVEALSPPQGCGPQGFGR